jgi:GNAT superfamily N-acetyltransferase
VRFSGPDALTAAHRVEAFDCGEAELNDWLKRRAFANHLSGASRTFVAADEGGSVCGYYALAAGAVAHGMATGGVRRNMPDPVPVLVLARLAVDRRAQGQKLGAALLQDAVRRATGVSREAGVRTLLVHALHERACAFYQYYGFQVSPLHPLTLMLRLDGGAFT